VRSFPVLLSTLLVPGVRPQDPSTVLAEVEKTPHFEIRFRPGSRAEASVDRIAAVVEEDLARILRELGLEEFPYTIRLFLYDDVAEIQRLTGVGSGGHSSPLESHVPHDNDQTRVHELVHVVAERFPERGPEPRSLFFAEGLSNAVLRFVHGVPVDAVAAFHRKRGDLPSLRELHEVEDFYAWLGNHPGFNGYDVAGSYVRYLLDIYGPAKVRRYVRGVSVRDAFGTNLERIERGWHARLDGFKLRPGLESLLEERAAGSRPAERSPQEATLDEEILGPSSEWRTLDRAEIPEGDPGRWEKRPGGKNALLVSGEKSQGDWSVARVGDRPIGDGIVCARAEALEGCFGVQIQLGVRCQAMVLRGQGAFLYNEVGGVAHDPRAGLRDAAVKIVLRRRGGRASVWVDGKLVGEADVDPAPAPFGVGSVGGRARFSDLAVRAFRE
jgi:hypothetical protein